MHAATPETIRKTGPARTADFLPALQRWFEHACGRPTPVQAAVWPVIAGGESALISAPTGSGKTLAAWLPLIDRVARRSPGASGVRVLYVSPLRALSRDMARNLGAPLSALSGVDPLPRLALRTGDTRPTERSHQIKCPPELLVTTPESLFVLLGSRGGRNMLGTTEVVVIDEIHALVENKRGAHLALSLERLEHLCRRTLQRIGISATQHPADRVATFLTGVGRDCRIIAVPATHKPEIRIELPACPLGAFTTQLHWSQIHDRLVELAAAHVSMLVFCNTRAQVERTARALGERLCGDSGGQGVVAAHHGSLGPGARTEVEHGLKSGKLRVVVSSASLELGIDIGAVELVCQLGSPGRINVLRQRAGRAGHRPDATPKARLFPLTLSDLLEAQALLEAVDAGQLDRTTIPTGPVDVLCQHLVAMACNGIRDTDVVYAIARRAYPWRDLSRAVYGKILDMLSTGYTPGRKAHRPLVRRTADRQELIALDDAGVTAIINAGTIPEWFEYDVVCQPGRKVLGRLDEDFAFESSPGRIFQLGNRILRILRITPGTVWVEDAPDETPNLPFWFGEGPARSTVLSENVLRLLDGFEANRRSLDSQGFMGESAAQQLEGFLGESLRVLGRLPGPNRVVFERFPDPGGDRHLVIHAPFGARVNRAWGLALRKRFCRSFNFELQAAATDNAVLLSLGPTHSFGLIDVAGYLKPESVRSVLIQALLDTPLYLTRFRWCANTALAIPRRDRRGPVPAQLQRNQAENLIALVFPDQLACLENLQGDRRIPDHPLVRQALDECLEDYLDAAGLERVLAGIHTGDIEVHVVDSPQPSLLAEAVIHAPRHAHLDPVAAEQRRTRSFERSPTMTTVIPGVPGGNGAGRLRARGAWIDARDRAGFERALQGAGYLLQREGETGVSATGAVHAGGWVEAFRALVHDRAAVRFQPDAGRSFWASVDRLPELLSVWPEGTYSPKLPAALTPQAMEDPVAALARLIFDRARVLGTATVDILVEETGLPAQRIRSVLAGRRPGTPGANRLIKPH